MTGDPRLVRALVACYPARWRRRYGDEYTQLLCDLRIHRRPRLIADSLRGAVRAHGGALMTSDSPMTRTVWAAGLFTVAGIGFAKLAEDVTDRAADLYTLVVAASAVALLALVAAAAPSAVALLKTRPAGVGRLLVVPATGVVAWFAALRLALALSRGHSAHAAATVSGFALIASTGIAVVAATAWSAATLLRRAPAPRPARLLTAALLTVAAGMAVATVAALLWGLRTRSADPAGVEGFLTTPFLPSWIAVVAALAVATTLAAQAGHRQLAAVR
jgi:hypothetical protein